MIRDNPLKYTIPVQDWSFLLMRNLIPRLQVAVARDRSRADRMLAGLAIGQEVFLSPLTEELFKVSDSPVADEARVLGVVPGEWSDRIAAAIASGRQCRAWYVGELPFEKSPDGSYRMLLTVWCSSSSRSGWREIGIEELVRTARVQDEPMPRPEAPRSPLFKSRIHDHAPARPPLAIPEVAQRGTAKASHPGTSASHTGLSAQQVDRIKEAVRKKLAERKTD